MYTIIGFEPVRKDNQVSGWKVWYQRPNRNGGEGVVATEQYFSVKLGYAPKLGERVSVETKNYNGREIVTYVEAI